MRVSFQYHHSIVTLGVILAGTLAILGTLASVVAAGKTLGFDAVVLTWIYGRSTPALDAFFVTITDLGGVIAVTTLTLVAIVLLVWKKYYRKAVLVGLGVGGVALLNVVLKGVFERARPDLWEWIVTETYFSFPSGHAVASSALALCCVAIFWRTKWRWAAVIGGALYTILIGVSRMYLGVHYPTDILGGWLLSAVWISFVALVLYGTTIAGRDKQDAAV